MLCVSLTYAVYLRCVTDILLLCLYPFCFGSASRLPLLALLMRCRFFALLLPVLVDGFPLGEELLVAIDLDRHGRNMCAITCLDR